MKQSYPLSVRRLAERTGSPLIAPDYEGLLDHADESPKGSAAWYARVELKEYDSLARFLRTKPDAQFRWTLQSVMVALIECICGGDADPMQSMSRSVFEVLESFAKGDFRYVPPPYQGFTSTFILDLAHGYINEEISRVGRLRLPTDNSQTFLPSDAIAKLAERGQFSQAAYLSNLLVATTAKSLAKRHRPKKGRRKQHANRVIEILAWHVVKIGCDHNLRWRLPAHTKKTAEGAFDLKAFPPVDLALRLRNMSVERAERYTRDAFSEREAKTIASTIKALKLFSELQLTKALAAVQPTLSKIENDRLVPLTR